MPRTVKLSEHFYQKFGHDLVDELVNWFNETDTAYRAELRELNDVNFARFDAKLEQRLAEFGAGLRLEIGAVGAAVAQSDAKLEQRLAQSDAKREQRLGDLRAELGALHGGLRAELGVLRGEFRAQLEAEGKLLMRWMLGLWIAAGAALYFFPLGRP